MSNYQKDEDLDENSLTIDTCKELLAVCQDYWGIPHDTFREDLEFANGKQWSEDVAASRFRAHREVQTYNIVPGFIRPLTNAVKECPPGITIYPIGDGANKDSAKILSGVIRSIEYQSNAQRAYTHGLECSAEGGLGAWRVLPKSVKKIEKRPEQFVDEFGVVRSRSIRTLVDKIEINIEQINDPTNVYFDPTSKLPDYSDANYVIYANVISKKDYKKLYPNGMAFNGVNNYDEVTVYELWKINDEGFVDFTVFDDNDILVDNKTELTILPFVLITGKRIELEGEVVHISATRDIKACQKELNWLKSEAISSISSAPKSMFIADDQALSNADSWAESATNPDAILYKKAGSNVEIIQPPAPPVGYMELANANIEMARQISGIYPDPSTQATLSNASGKAIKYQQATSQIQTYHFIEALNYGIKRTGEIVLDQIAVYYNDDDVRVAMGIDNTYTPVSIGPTQVPNVQNLDLTNGIYGVTISSGPSYSTQKQALIDQLLEMGRTTPNIMPLISDVIVKNLNLPGSEELGDRFKVMMPAPIQELLKAQEATNNNPSEVIRNQAIQLQQLSAQFEQSKQHLEMLSTELEQAKNANEVKIAEMEYKKQINDDNIKAKFAMQESDHEQQDAMAKLNAKLELILAKMNHDNNGELENQKSLNKISEHLESRE